MILRASKLIKNNKKAVLLIKKVDNFFNEYAEDEEHKSHF